MEIGLDTPSSGREVFVKQNCGRRLGFGKSGALLIVDFVNSFTDPALFGSLKMRKAIRHTRLLLEAARNAAIPFVYTRIVFAEDGSDLESSGSLLILWRHELDRRTRGGRAIR